MKKVLSYILVVAIILAMGIGFGGMASAASVAASVEAPSMMTGGGDASVKVLIKNNDSQPITNVQVFKPDGSSMGTLDSIGAGETKGVGGSGFQVTDAMLGNPMTFKIVWTNPDGSQSQGSTSATIKKGTPEAKVETNLKASTTTAKSGDKVKFTFTIKNTGDVTITNAYLKAPPLNGGDKLGSDFSLEPGATNTKEWSEPLTADTTVKPVYTLAVNGSQKTVEVSSVTVKVESAKTAGMTVNLTADSTEVAQGGSVTLTASVTNTGTASLKNLTVADAAGSPLTMDKTTLGVNETATGTITYNADASASASVTATATDEAGKTVTVQSNSVSITVGAAAQPSAEPTPEATVDPAKVVYIEVGLSTNTLPKPGDVTFNISVKNKDAQELKDIVVSETTLGTLGTIATLGAGETQQLEAKTVEVKDTSSFVFTVTATMADGTTIETSTPAAEITVENPKAAGGLGSFTPILIIIIVAIVGVGAALGFFIYRNKKQGGSGPRGGGYSGSGRSNPPRNSGNPPRNNGGYGGYNERPRQSQQPRQGYNERPQQPRQMPRERVEPRPQPRQPQRPSGGDAGRRDRNNF